MERKSRMPSAAARWAILEIDVENHPGVMAHVVGLFTRRGCNIESIVCVPQADTALSRIWLAFDGGTKLARMVKLAAGLEDVRAVRRCDDFHAALTRLRELCEVR